MQPKNSPWGQVDHCEILADGVYAVSTPGHGGIMVLAGKYKISQPAMQFGGEVFGKFICFEEDCAWSIAAFELRKLGVTIAPHVPEEDIKKTILRWFPAYAAEVDLKEDI